MFAHQPLKGELIGYTTKNATQLQDSDPAVCTAYQNSAKLLLRSGRFGQQKPCKITTCLNS